MASDAENLAQGKGIKAARASGTSLWVETDTPSELVAFMRSQGVIVKQYGNKVVAKPALIMGAPQANELLNALHKF
jgi:adenosylmethionine-8-amino-7-oxononanoate aminotransferase